MSFVTLVANALPHHHHNQYICLTESFGGEVHVHDEDESALHFHCSHHGACDDDCVTRFLFVDTNDERQGEAKGQHHDVPLAALAAACQAVAAEHTPLPHYFTHSAQLPRATAHPTTTLRAPPCLG